MNVSEVSDQLRFARRNVASMRDSAVNFGTVLDAAEANARVRKNIQVIRDLDAKYKAHYSQAAEEAAYRIRRSAR
jgi:hypothetical protein